MGKEYRRKVDVESLISIPVEPVLIDSFEDVLMWGVSGAGADWDAYRDSQQAFEGDISFYVITKATTPASGDWIEIVRYPPIIKSRLLSIEIMFRVATPSGGEFFLYLSNLLVDPVDLVPYSYNLRLNNVLGRFEMETASGVWTNVGSTSPIAIGYWQRLAMVIDTYEKKVISAETGKQYLSVDRKAWGATPVASTYYQLAIKLETRTAARASANLDNIVVKATEL